MNSSILFKGIPAEAANRIKDAPECFAKRFSSEAVIYSETDFCKAIGIVQEGSAVVKSAGSDSVVIRRLEAGDCFGVAAVFGGEEYVSKIIAESECEVLFIPETVMKKYMKEYPELCFNYISFLTGRIKYLNVLVDAYSSPSVTVKLAKFIYAHMMGSDVPFGFTLMELSRSLAVGRASLYRALDELSALGIIEKDGKLISVKDPQKLERYIKN